MTALDILFNELASGLPSLEQAIRIVVRLLAATAFAAVVGYERESVGKSAGLRAHMLVALGSAIFILASLEAGDKFDRRVARYSGRRRRYWFHWRGRYPQSYFGARDSGTDHSQQASG